MRRQLVAGALASLPGLAALVLATVFGPGESGSWVILGLVAALVAVHPMLRGFHLGVVVVVLVLTAVRAGLVGLPLPVAAGLGLLLFGYLLALDLAAAIGAGSEPVWPMVSHWFNASAVPVAAGLGGTAIAVVAASLPLRPSLPLALAGLAAIVLVAMLALRDRVPAPSPGSVEHRDR